MMAEYLVPMLMAAPDLAAARVQSVLAPVKGHQMAKAALETAVLDAELRTKQMSFAQYLGAVRDRVPAGVSVGIPDSLTELIGLVEGYIKQGYQRVKLKIEPGWDVEPIRAVRERRVRVSVVGMKSTPSRKGHAGRRLCPGDSGKAQNVDLLHTG